MKRNNKYRQAYSHLWQTYGRSWQVRLSYALRIISQACKLIILPIALSLIITRLSESNYEGAKQAVLIFALASLLVGVISPLIRYVGMLGENKVYRDSTAAYFSKLIDADLDYFNSSLSGYLTSATRQYVDSCVQLIRALRDRYLITVMTIIFPLGVIAWIDVQLGIIAIALSAVQAAYLLWASRAIDGYRTQSRELYKKNSGRMADTIANILAVKSNAREQVYANQVKQGAVDEAAIFKRRYTLQAKLIALREAITVSFFLALLWLTVQRMADGSIGLTAAILIATYATTILTGIYSLSDNLDEHDDFIDKILPAFEILNRRHKVNDPPDPKPLHNVRGNISLQSVSFSYDGNHKQTVLKNLTLNIPAGQRLGIVGLSGAGKSTVTRLLLRFNDVDEGAIYLDGVDIRDVRQADLRQQIAYVPQEPLLFHASIRDNVLLADPDANEAQLQAALRASHAYTFVSDLPDKLDSIVGERGVKLSGGQKQRIAIARAVLRRAPIIVLDEATSALDSESEQIIKDSFAEILAGKTAIVIAHRLSTLSEMDRIVVIDKGRLVEDGSHNELLAANGMYAKLWRRQLKHIDD